MKRVIFVSILLIMSCKDAKVKTETETETSQAPEIAQNVPDNALEVYDYNGLKQFLNKQDDKIYVVNFWATWCAPCVKELPYFEELNEKYKKDNVEVLLVSLDFPKHYEKKLLPFIEKHKLESKVVALDDPDQNTWIPAIDKDWTGAIPATIIYNKDKRSFYEQSFDYEELETELKKYLK